MNEKQYWIMLAGIFGPGNRNIWKLMKTCSTPSEGYGRICEGKYTLTPGEKERFSLWTKEKAGETVRECELKDIKIITFSDSSYPSGLKTIFNPPAVLYACGNTACLNDEVSVAVVGTRKPSQYGYDAAYIISGELAKAGFTTVSGFATGIDSACHRGTLSAGGSTIAVLGCGPENDYPKSNSDIRNAVTEKGVLISEFPPGTPPLPKNFPLRNRIISGLSLGVFIAEAPLRSGALITAECAIEQGRDLFCLPPSDIFSKSFQGVVKYLRDGAVPVFSHLDIIYEYCSVFSHRLSPPSPSDEYVSGRTDSLFFGENEADLPAETKGISKAPAEIYTAEKKNLSVEFDFSDVQMKISELLLNGPLHLDEIAERTAISMSDLLMEITDMEIMGAVKSLPGKNYTLNV